MITEDRARQCPNGRRLLDLKFLGGDRRDGFKGGDLPLRLLCGAGEGHQQEQKCPDRCRPAHPHPTVGSSNIPHRRCSHAHRPPFLCWKPYRNENIRPISDAQSGASEGANSSTTSTLSILRCTTLEASLRHHPHRLTGAGGGIQEPSPASVQGVFLLHTGPPLPD